MRAGTDCPHPCNLYAFFLLPTRSRSFHTCLFTHRRLLAC
jgi:hypothetical protein